MILFLNMKSLTLLHSEASGDGKTIKISLDNNETKKQDELISKYLMLVV